MPVLKISLNEIYGLIDQLDDKKKMKVFERLKSKFISNKWSELFARIDKRTAMHSITDEEISEEVERGREEFASRRD